MFLVSRQGKVSEMCWLAKLERLLLGFGLMMLGVYLAAWTHRSILSQAALETFERPQLRAADQMLSAPKPDFTLWSPQRVKGYEDRLATYLAPAIAVLRIPNIHLETLVLEGTDELSLNRGVGRIAGTAHPAENGNMGIAGHRDGFFRGLKDVRPGDTIEMITLRRTRTYVVDRVVIVNPDDTSVLEARPRPSLTLVTCYPFYFVGSAPQRYIVQASVRDLDSGSSSRMERSSPDTSSAEGEREFGEVSARARN
jgi:sortase A